MATYVIGDVHGCRASLEDLLGRIGWRRATDELVFCGDLVNRGPDSLGVARWFLAAGERVHTVLGNHDLAFSSLAAGVREPGRKDTLEALLGASACGDFLARLRAAPLLVSRGADFVVHAGLLPSWSVAVARRRAEHAAEALASNAWRSVLRAWRAPNRAETREVATAAETLRVLTLLRAVDEEGRPDPDFAGPPEDLPAGRAPWYARWRPAPGEVARIHFGHWAAAGHRLVPCGVALDSGCVWGNGLTARRLEDGAVFHVPTAPGDGARPA